MSAPSPVFRGWTSFRRFRRFAATLAVLATGAGAHAIPPKFVDSGNEPVREAVASNNGVVTLQWSGEPEGRACELVQARSSDFSGGILRYSGPDRKTILTGLENGRHYFRLRFAGEEEWSRPLVAEVAYVSRGNLLAMLGAGALVVILTVGVIVRGHLRSGASG